VVKAPARDHPQNPLLPGYKPSSTSSYYIAGLFDFFLRDQAVRDLIPSETSTAAPSACRYLPISGLEFNAALQTRIAGVMIPENSKKRHF